MIRYSISMAAVFAIVVVIFVLCIHRLFFHQLATFPGPQVAACTLWYKAFFDIVMDGGWSEHLDSLHARYGPVVRVAPNELHFSDPKAYADIYGMGTKFTKHGQLYSCFATDLSVFALTNPHEAMQRRNLIGTFFSRKTVLSLEGVIQTQIENLIARLLEAGPEEAVDIEFAFRAASLDIVTAYCFDLNEGSLVVSKDFQNDVLLAMDATLPMIWVFKYLPQVKHFLLSVPEWTAAYLKPGTIGILDQRRKMGAQIDGLLKDPSSLSDLEHETIYHHFLRPQQENQRIPPLSRNWLLEEGLYLRFAGSDTVGNVCTVGAYYILTIPRVHMMLTEELCSVWPDADSSVGCDVLEKLPILTAVIKESLRMAHGVVTPLPRVVGPTDTEISGTIIPSGTIVSMGATVVHRNPNIFKDPYVFQPERWLQKDAHELDKYLVSFSKGPRSCLGINLAWCELYLIFGNIFRRLALEAKHPSIDNVSFREYFVPLRRGKHLKAYIQARGSYLI